MSGKIIYETVELKSTKSDAIPGSSVQQISPYEWVIFIKHGKTDVDISTGQYLNSVNSHMQFPDRSPRPQVSFSELKNWNKNNRIVNSSSIQFSLIDDVAKKRLLKDWQGVLAERWLEVVFSGKKRKSEPWFNNNLRKFILLFIDKYEKMSLSEKKLYTEMLKKLIEK